MTVMIELAEIINVAVLFVSVFFEFVGRIFVGTEVTTSVAIAVGILAIIVKQRVG